MSFIVPQQIDGAKVIAYVILNSDIHQDSGSIRLITNRQIQSWFHGLAIAQYDRGTKGTYLFFCDCEWETENDTLHDSIADAMQAAREKFGVMETEWKYTDSSH